MSVKLHDVTEYACKGAWNTSMNKFTHYLRSETGCLTQDYSLSTCLLTGHKDKC